MSFKRFNVFTFGPGNDLVLIGEAMENRDQTIEIYLKSVSMPFTGHLRISEQFGGAPRPKPLPPPRPPPTSAPSSGTVVGRIARPSERVIRSSTAELEAAKVAATRGTGIEHTHAPGFTNVAGCAKCHCDRIVAEELERADPDPGGA